MQVNVLVEFLIDNCRELFAEEAADLSRPAAEESPAPMDRSTGMSRDRACTCHSMSAVLV